LVELSASPTRPSLLHGQDQPGLQWWQRRALITTGIAVAAIKFHLASLNFKVKIHLLLLMIWNRSSEISITVDIQIPRSSLHGGISHFEALQPQRCEIEMGCFRNAQPVYDTRMILLNG